MAFRHFFWAAAALVVLAAGYGAYAPDVVEKTAPAAGPLAQRLHALLPASFKREGSQPATAQAAPAASAQSRGPQPILVSVAPVKRADFPIVVEGLGQVQAYNTVTVRARVDGQIMKVAYTEGQDVKAGDLLVEIDPRPFQAALDQAKAKKTQDEANLANAKLDLGRYSTLAKQSYATQQQLDTQSALVDQLIAQIAADTAAVAAAQVQLDYTTIRAPISGRAGLRLVDEGNLVAASQQTSLVSIAQIEPIAVIFTVPEEDVGQINAVLAKGEPKVVVKDTSGKELATGKLTLTDNQIDASTGTIRLKAEFPNADHALWPGLAVSADLTIGDDKDVLTVPAIAIQHGQKGLFAYVVDDQNRAALRNVTVSRQNIDTMVVAKGLKDSDRVITTGLFLLQPGSPVTLDAAGSGS
jgi:multidrug efflux system membrane fusion protein